jgi:hypothetical protein
VTITATQTEAFTLPEDIAISFHRAIRQEMIASAFNACRHLSSRYVRQNLPRFFQLPPFCDGVFTDHYGTEQVLLAVNIRTKIVEDAIEAQQEKAVKTLEKKVNQAVKDGETITNVSLYIDDQRMISGTVSGEGFCLDIKSIWNYRYGENSANGILTVYTQNRVNRRELG